jgi:hypothetical protein
VVAGTVPVNVSNGRFSVNLGGDGTQELPDTVFTTGGLSLVIWINNGTNEDPNWHRLPPQKLQTVPHAVTAKRATSFVVTQDLLVEGNATVRGNATIQGRLISDRSAAPPEGQSALMITNHAVVGQADNRTHFNYTSGGQSKNFIRGNETIISSDTKFERSLHVSGTLSAARLGERNCVGVVVAACGHNCVGTQSQMCPEGKYMRGFSYEPQGSEAIHNIAIHCCDP